MTDDLFSKYGEEQVQRKPKRARKRPETKKEKANEEKDTLRRQYRNLTAKEEAEVRAAFPILNNLDDVLDQVQLVNANKFMTYVRTAAPAIPDDPKARFWAVRIIDRHIKRLRKLQGVPVMEDPLPKEMGGTGSVFDMAKAVIYQYDED